MRMQIALRPLSDKRQGYLIHAAVGVVEIAPEEEKGYEETFVNFRLEFDNLGRLKWGRCLANPRQIEGEFDVEGVRENLFHSDLESLLKAQFKRTLPDENQNMEVAFRQTDVEASVPGGCVYAFVGLLYTKPEIVVDSSKLYELKEGELIPGYLIANGTLGASIRPELGPLDVNRTMKGDALSSFLRKPWWGFGPEPVELPGTMRKASYADQERYTALFFETRNPEQQAEFETLRVKMKALNLNQIEKDPDFAKFVKARRSLPDFQSPYYPVPLSRAVSRETSVDLLVQSLLADELRM